MKRYNLELNENYTLIDSFYTGPLTDGGGTCCDNCNRMITNVAVIKNSKDQQFNVGLDCAETLSNIQGLNKISAEFAELKALTAKINKLKKLNQEVTFIIRTNGSLYCELNHQTVWAKPLEYANKYLKHYLKQVSNPEKIGFSYSPIKIILPFEKSSPKENVGMKHKVNLENDYSFIVEIESKNNMHNFVTILFHKGKLVREKTMYMYNQIIPSINWGIQENEFNLFNNPNHG